MTKKIQNQEEVAVAEAVSKTEQFFENNGKKVIIAVVALLLLVAGGYAYKYLVFDKNEAAANELIIVAQDRFSGENPDFELALNGDESGAGFLAVIEQYGSTDAGNIANHYAGICYLRLGDLENAAKYLKAYNAVGGSVVAEIIDAQNIGLQGDIAVENGDLEAAVKLFAKAVKASDNLYTTPLYLRKQGLALKALGRQDEAVAVFEKILAEYPASMDAREAEKLLGE